MKIFRELFSVFNYIDNFATQDSGDYFVTVGAGGIFRELFSDFDYIDKFSRRRVRKIIP